jgi:hypothetical protein
MLVSLWVDDIFYLCICNLSDLDTLTYQNPNHTFGKRASKNRGGNPMQKAIAIFISLALFTVVAVSPVYSAGGKNHGEVGQGEVDQGDMGSDMGSAQGDNAQDNQTD